MTKQEIINKMTEDENSLVNKLIPTPPETINGIPFNGLEVALIDVCYGARMMGQTKTLKTAYELLIKLNPMAQAVFSI